ncbi:hypothetical protein [Nostoc sp.]
MHRCESPLILRSRTRLNRCLLILLRNPSNLQSPLRHINLCSF